jgi:SAM-dependent methyltransferase
VSFTYDSGVFDVGNDIDRAKWVILNPDGVHTPEERWQVETEYLLDLMDAYMPSRDATALDFGCGIGRVAKPLIERKGWDILGLDISSSMLRMATKYVCSPKFLGMKPDTFSWLARFTLSVDFAIATWSLQHCQHPKEDVALITAALRPGGRLFVLNAAQRFVPSRERPWSDDGVNIYDLLNKSLICLHVDQPDLAIVPGPQAFWGVYEKG